LALTESAVVLGTIAVFESVPAAVAVTIMTVASAPLVSDPNEQLVLIPDPTPARRSPRRQTYQRAIERGNLLVAE
jgi:hypothetical protein